MKKIGLAMLMVAVASSMVFAQRGGAGYDEYHEDIGGRTSQVTSSLSSKVERTAVRQTPKRKVPNVQRVEEELQTFRQRIHSLQRDDSITVMQLITTLAETFLDEISENSRTEAFVARKGVNVPVLVSAINEPVRTGWQANNFYIAQEIETFLSYRWHEEVDENMVAELEVFLSVLKKHPFYEDMDYRLRNRLLDFRYEIASASEENMPVIMQSLLLLADDYFEAYALLSQVAKTEGFVAKPTYAEVAANVARELDQEIDVGWAPGVTIKPSDYIGRNIYSWDRILLDKSPADELNVFARVLSKAAQKK